MTKTKNNHHKNSGCFSNFLQKIVCAGDLPTHPCPHDEIVQKIGKRNSVCDQKKHIVANKNNGSDIADRSRVQVQVRDQVISPGIVAKLMGLDSMPSYESNATKSSTYESLFRSKSLNSLHFRPDFDPTRAAFHRRGRTSSASFHDQGGMILVTIDENLESNGAKLKEDCKVDREDLKQKREKVVRIEGNDSNECRKVRKNNVRDKKRYQERYYKGDSVIRCKSRSKKSNVGAIGGLGGNNSREKSKCTMHSSRLAKTKTVSHQACSRVYEERKEKVGSPILSKKKVELKQDLCDDQSSSDLSLQSPISVLDYQDEVDSPSREDTQITSNSRRKSSPRSKLFSDMPKVDVHVHPNSNSNSNKNDDDSNKSSSKHQLMEVDTQVTECFVDLLRKACVMGEEQICEDLKRVTGKYELFKEHYVKHLCQVLGQEMLEALLRELIYELS